MYKILFSDLDETLLDKNMDVPKVNQDAISKMIEAGKYFVCCTGRSYDMCRGVLSQTGQLGKANQYLIVLNGGMVVSCDGFKPLYSNLMTYELVKEVFDFFKERKMTTMIFTNDCVYFINPSKAEVDRKIKQKANFKIIEEDDIELLKDEAIAKIIYGNPDNFDYLLQCEKDIQPYIEGRLEATFSSGRYIEFNRTGVTKGSAIQWLCEYLNIDMSETAGIGDNYNDLSMLEACELSCVVKSGVEEVKKMAKYVTQKDYEEGAVAEVIEKYFL